MIPPIVLLISSLTSWRLEPEAVHWTQIRVDPSKRLYLRSTKHKFVLRLDALGVIREKVHTSYAKNKTSTQIYQI